MKNRRLIIRTVILGVLVAALGFTLYSNFFTSKKVVGIGDKAPNFILENMSGEQVEFNTYRGKGVFLNFWGTWCKPCEKEMPFMNNVYEEYKNKGVEILAVNVGESKLAVQKFIDRHSLDFPVVIDEDLEVLEAYGVNPLPTTFLIDKDGTIVDIITGSLTEESIRNYMDRIKP